MSGEGSSPSGKPSSSQAQSQGETGQKKDGAEEPREGEGEGQEKPSDQPSENGEPKSSQPDQPGGIKDRGDKAAEGEREAVYQRMVQTLPFNSDGSISFESRAVAIKGLT